MLREWLDFLQLLFARFVFGTARAIQGNTETSKELAATTTDNNNTTCCSTSAANMSNTQVSLVGSADRQVEQESTEETTLSEMSKDLGHTKISEQSAKFEGSSTTSIVEENKSKNVESSCKVLQSVSQEVSQSRKVTSSTFSSSQSYSMEESEEYEIEG